MVSFDDPTIRVMEDGETNRINLRTIWVKKLQLELPLDIVFLDNEILTVVPGKFLQCAYLR